MNIIAKVVNHFKKNIILNPKLGILNFRGKDGEKFVKEDLEKIKHLFYSIFKIDTDFVNVDVLLLYCDIKEDGTIGEDLLTLEDIISKTGAKIIIFATDNNEKDYLKINKYNSIDVNLVMTLDRRDIYFGGFLQRLFELISKGITMSSAWVTIAPQNSNDPKHKECPKTLFLCHQEKIVFKLTRSNNFL